MAKKKRRSTKGNTFRSSKSNSKRRGRKGGSFGIGTIVGFIRNEKFHMVLGLFLAIFSIYLLIAFTSFIYNWLHWGADDPPMGSFFSFLVDSNIQVNNVTGRMGAWLSALFIKQWFGLGSYLFLLILFVLGIRIFLRFKMLPFIPMLKHSFFWLVWLSVTCGFLFPETNPERDLSILGGAFGVNSSQWLSGAIGRLGAGTLLFFGLTAYFVFAFNQWGNLKRFADKERLKLIERRARKKASEFDSGDLYNTQEYHVDDVDKDFKTDDTQTREVEFSMGNKSDAGKDSKKSDTDNDIDFTVIQPKEEEADTTIKDDTDKEITTDNHTKTESKEHYDLETLYDPKLDLRDYRFPDIELLAFHGSNTISVQKSELESNKNKIIQTLKNYSIDIDKIKATIGPTVTLYEIVPAPGIRISKIKNLEDDIALSLSALGIRIIAPIPGRGTIGIEVPNMKPEIVSMRTILGSERFRNNNYELPIGLGKTISNESFVADLTKMPHLLIAGATGQGKSVGLNAIITSLLYTKHPAELKFILVDPKKVELSLFSRIQRHFLAKLPDTEEAIINDNKIVVRTLNSLCIEMDNRYNMLKAAQVRNVAEYNEKFTSRRLNPVEGHKFMPYLVLIVDEFADLIMTSGKEIEGPIARLAQLARAVGIHLIIATQRPSVNIITGIIKANFPARIAFRVTAKVDSRTILDTSGAEQLVGRGDMLLSTGSDLTRLQCAFLDIPEVENITDFIGSQRGYPEAYELPEYHDDENDNQKEFDPSDKDELFEEAARTIVRHQHGSTSLLQRKLKLGYNRAGRLIDQLEAAGIVGPFEGSKAREVLFSDEYSLEQHLNNL